MQKPEPKKNWIVTSSAFHRLLDWLDEGSNSDGQNYLEMRQRLVAYFDRKNCQTPDEYADETLNRVARRLEEAGTIESETPAKYCYIMARFVFLEYLRDTNKNHVPLDEVLRQPQGVQLAATESSDEKQIKEKMLDCLDQCTNKLEPQNRDIIISYYFGSQQIKIENRRLLAQRLGVSINALSIRACRIRDKLEVCVGKCVRET
ncbi:MAG: hypothetical protein ABI954_00490 [Pyrinomonadaceae bacterium]